MIFEKNKKYECICRELKEIHPPKEFPIIQGGYFDGKDFFIAFVHKDSEGYERTRIAVFDDKLSLVRMGGVINTDHSNNLTFNDKKGKLFITHCQSPDKHFARYSFIDRDTLEVTESGDLPYPFFSMAYSKEKDMYFSGEWSGQTLDTWDGELNNVKHIDVEMPKSLSQGCFADGNYGYFVRSSMNGVGPELRVYDWDCNLVTVAPIFFTAAGDTPDNVEPESINIVDGKIYVVCNHPCGGKCYTMEIKEK